MMTAHFWFSNETYNIYMIPVAAELRIANPLAVELRYLLVYYDYKQCCVCVCLLRNMHENDAKGNVWERGSVCRYIEMLTARISHTHGSG